MSSTNQRFSSDVLSEAIKKRHREKVAKKIRKRKENGWEEVHREMKSCELSEAIQNLPPELRERILKEYIAAKINEKNEMGWKDVHEDIKSLPYCEIQGQITKVFLCIQCNCKLSGLCVACYENETCPKCKPCRTKEFCLGCFQNKTKYHTLVSCEEACEQEEKKGFIRIWGAPKLISESKQEIKEREKGIKLIRMVSSVDKLCEEYLEQNPEKRRKRAVRC